MKRITSKLRRTKRPVQPADSRITNDTVAEHREQVLGRARKYIYPLRQSKHKLVLVSISLFLVALVVFFTYCTLALYKFKSESSFIYKVTQVIPFPVARKGSDFVAYENYLFEINHYTHYYRTQQSLDFSSEAGQTQLTEFRKRALDKVINDAYVKKLAADKGITVSDQEVDDEIATVRNQNRLGANDTEFQDVLRDFWDWSEADFKRSLKLQLLRDKVASGYDDTTHDRAKQALEQLKAGKDFGTLAKEVSDDEVTKQAGGDFGAAIEKTNRDINPKTIDALFKLKDNEYSEVIDVGTGLEIIKRVQTQGDEKVRAAHIIFNFKNVDDYINDAKEKESTRSYLRL